MRIAILDDIHHAYEGTSGVQRLRERAEVRIFTSPIDDPAVLRGFDALIANRERTRFTRSVLEQLPDVRVIVQTGTHAHHIDFAAARERGIEVLRASGGYSIGAAELAIGLTIALLRRIPEMDGALKRGMWPTPTTRELHGKTLGLIGLGRIGRHVAAIAAAFGMRVLAWSPRLSATAATAAGAELVPLDDLMRTADVVSIHAVLSPQSRGLIDARRIGLMKPTAYLVNTARAAIVDQPALFEALSQHRIAGAGLDVFEQEPLPAGHPLTMLPNVILTPHIGWPTDGGYARFSAAASEALLAYMDGKEVDRFNELN